MTTTNKIIETAYDTYLIRFKNSSNADLICTYTDIAEALKRLNNGYFLADIYRYNPAKVKFNRVPQNKYSLLFGWNTEAIEILNKFKLIK